VEYSVITLGRLRQEDGEFKTSLSYTERPCQRERERERDKDRDREREFIKHFVPI
jgi:hypothetical protein